LPEAVLAAAQKGDPRVRAAAIEVIGRLGDAASVPALVEIAGGGDAQAAQAAKAALVGLSDQGVDQQITSRLGEADGATLAALIEVVGQRRIHATGELMKAVDHGDDSIRKAALAALGATVDSDDLPKLLTCALQPKHAGDADAASRALEAACVRMADREGTAAELFAALPQADTATKARILHILGAMGGPKALESIAAAAKEGDTQLQDAATRVLGEWMTADAAPVLLDLAQDPANKKYQVRALRGYLRLARQFDMPDKQRAAMCASALKAATRPEERQLALEVLERYPSQAALEVAVKAAGHDELKSAATATALAIAEKLAASGSDPQAALAKLGLPSVKLEIVKAQYGAGDSQKDVTAALHQRAGAMPLISLPSASYNDAFGGDPAPGVAKQLKIEYRIDGKPASASFAENAAILLPMPQ
jgi:HEAT repeat protein